LQRISFVVFYRNEFETRSFFNEVLKHFRGLRTVSFEKEQFPISKLFPNLVGFNKNNFEGFFISKISRRKNE
jgi:hypothetical protein